MSHSIPLPTRRAIQFRSWAILVGLALITALSLFWLLFGSEIEARSVQLQEMARSQARFFEATGKFNAMFQSGEVAGAAQAATLSQIKEGHRQYQGFGETGEMMLAQRIGPDIVFLLPTRGRDARVPSVIPWSSAGGGPMRLALEGQSGVVRDRDHAGAEVLAAYEWLPFLEMGLVCQVDMAEIRAPFVRAGLWTAAIALLLTLLGLYFNARTVLPLVSRVMENAEMIRERESQYRSLVASIPGAVFRARLERQHAFLELSDAITGITGRPASEFLAEGGTTIPDILHPEDVQRLRTAAEQRPRPGESYETEYRILRPDGETRWVSERGTVVTSADGSTLLEGVLLDVSARKEAEGELQALAGKLSRYLSPQVYRSIFHGASDALVGSTRKKLTVFFSDIVEFTAKSDALDPDDLSFVVNSYLNRMATVAIEYGGTLDKFIGDGVLIFFGDPETKGVAEDARACVPMAQAMQEAITDLNRATEDAGIAAKIEVRIGITTGNCTVGNFGSDSRMDYTILGKTVNLASRLEAAAGAGGISVSRETWLLVRDHFACEELEPIRAKGFDRAVSAFRVLPSEV